VAKLRLDTLLTQRGLFESRSRAAASVLAGEVTLGADRRRASKPGQLVAEEVEVEVAQRPRFVSRGGVKLANALAATGIDVAGRRCLDVGASTGGFSDCLLQEGATAVTAVDVAYGELAWSVRNDERVTVIERTNARTLTPESLPYAPDLIVIDVSFISLTRILPPVLACAAPRFDALALIKPQFEVGRDRIGGAALALGTSVLRFASSGLPGPKGNRETFVWLAEPGRQGSAASAAEIEAMAREVEP
jgi:23S rRNA (cytidine1920-2'-O)/16S rRNA (cytidine1409-2'-O)-methyltransferase